MAKVIFYAACSLDGYLAREDDDFSWLFPYGLPESYGFADFMKRIGPIIMGSRTYEVILDHERGGWNYKGHPAYVMTRRKNLPKPAGEDITFFNEGWERLVAKLKKGRKDIWHVGGGLSLAPFLNKDLIDEIWLFVFPILLKAGKPAFLGLDREMTFKLKASKASKSGVVLLHYVKEKAAAPRRKPPKPGKAKKKKKKS